MNFVYESVYPADHGYHDHSTHTSIDNIKLADLQKFMDDYYTPENTTIFVVGDFDPQEAASLIFANFAPELLHPRLTADNYFQAPKPGVENPDQNNPDDWLIGAYDPDNPGEPFRFSTRDAPRITEDRPPVPPVGTTEVVTREAPVEKKTLAVAWSLPGGFRSDHWNLQLLGNFASQYIFQGLYEEIDNKQIGDWGCFSQAEVLNTTMICIAELKDEKLDPLRIRDKILNQFAEMWNRENISTQTIQSQLYNASLTRAKMELMSSLLLDIDVFAQEFGGRGESITPHIHYTNSVMATSEGMEQVMAIDANTIADLAYNYLKRDRAATVILEPLPEEDIDIGSENSTYQGANATDQVLKSADDLSAVTDEQIADSYVLPNLDSIQDFQLPNGMRVVVLEHGEAPLVEASLVLRRDLSKDPAGMLDFAARFARGPGNDALPIAARQNYTVYPSIGAGSVPFSLPFNLEPGNITGNSIRMGIRAPAGNLDGALWLLREEVEGVKPYIDGKSDFVDSQEGAVKGGWADRDWHLDAARAAYLYPNSPWRQPTSWEDVEKMSSWGNSDLDAWLNTELQPANATLLIVGNLPAKDAKDVAIKYFGGWKGRGSAPPPSKDPATPEMPTAPAKVLVYDDPKRTQTDLNTSCRLNVTDREQEYAVSVLGSLLRNRTFTQMRVKEGLAYSPGAFAAIDSDGSGSLTFYSDGVVNSGVQRMISFFNEAMDEVEAGDVDREEITLNKLRQARLAGVSAQSISQMTGQMVGVLRNGEDWEAMTQRGEHIASVSPDDLKGLIDGCREHSITTLVGPKDVITPQLDELGLDYEVVQWQADGDALLWKHDPKAAKKKEKARQKAEKKKAKADAKKKKGGDEEEGDE
ncbi:MAG: insulinase family protein [Myxococcota bacterium]